MGLLNLDLKNKTPKQVAAILDKVERELDTLIGKSDAELQRLSDASVATWGIPLASQIYYWGAFGYSPLQHHGIFVADGAIIDVAGAGKWCRAASNTGVLDQCLGLARLNDFAFYGKGKLFRVVYPDASPIRERLARLKQLRDLAVWDYNPATHNCQHWSSWVMTGKAEFTQTCPRRTSVPITLPPPSDCGTPCEAVWRTADGGTCAGSDVKTGVFGSKYCGSTNQAVTAPYKYGCYKSNSSKVLSCATPTRSAFVDAAY